MVGLWLGLCLVTLTLTDQRWSQDQCGVQGPGRQCGVQGPGRRRLGLGLGMGFKAQVVAD